MRRTLARLLRRAATRIDKPEPLSREQLASDIQAELERLPRITVSLEASALDGRKLRLGKR